MTRLPWPRGPLVQGLLLGYGLPLLAIAPTLASGAFNEFLHGARVYFLLPAFVLLLFPSALGAALLAPHYRTRQAVWRLSVGAFLGGSAAGAVLLAASTMDIPLLRQVGTSIFGGPLLVGFWTWLGAFLGGYIAYDRHERRLQPHPEDE